MSSCSHRKLSVKDQNVSFLKVSFPGFHNHVISQFNFQATQLSFNLFLLFEKGCLLSITDEIVFCSVDLYCESFVLLTELNHLRMLS